jgi:hypothetical protein
MLADDHKDYIIPAVIASAADSAIEGVLYIKSIVDTYIATVIEL